MGQRTLTCENITHSATAMLLMDGSRRKDSREERWHRLEQTKVTDCYSQTAYVSTNIESGRVHHPKHKNSNPILKSGLSSPYLYVGIRLGLVSNMTLDPEQNNMQQGGLETTHFKPTQAKVLDCFSYSWPRLDRAWHNHNCSTPAKLKAQINQAYLLRQKSRETQKKMG